MIAIRHEIGKVESGLWNEWSRDPALPIDNAPPLITRAPKLAVAA